MDLRIRERILRAPLSSSVVPGSTPVISFGDFTAASLATVSINPSSREFLQGKRLLPTGQKRLVDKESLGISLDAPIENHHAEKVWEGCRKYFSPEGNPLDWFSSLNQVLSHVGRKFDLNNTCHIDLVQSATFPAWGQLSANEQKNFLDADYEFFSYQVSMPNLKYLLVNGRKVYEQLRATKGFTFDTEVPLPVTVGGKIINTSLFKGVGPYNKQVLGWTGTLKSLRISNEVRSELYLTLGDWLRKEL